MSATIYAFPTAWDVDQAEFDRKGTSNLTRALADGCALRCAVEAKASRAALAPRLYAFAERVARLASYRDDLPTIELAGGSVELTLLPDVLLAMAGLKPWPEQAQAGRAEIRQLFPRAAAG